MSELQEKLADDPLPSPDLKAERVQDGLIALPQPPIDARLKAERVEQRLQQMPEWSLSPGGGGIDRARKLASPFGAADYATFVLREAARTRQKVQIGLSGSRVMVTVLAPSRGQHRGAIGMDQVDFAASLV
jgi:hypothetical protein